MTEPDPASVLRGPRPADPPIPAENGHHGNLNRYDLAGVMRAGFKPPTAFMGLIYRAKLHTIAGPPEAGKTLLSLWLAWQAMKEGRNVLMLDEETGPLQVADLFRSMGADPQLIQERFYYLCFPDLDWHGEDVIRLHELGDELKPAITIFDSATELLAQARLDENSSHEVTRFYKSVLRPMARRVHSATILIDHDGKDGGKPGNRYARGSTAKLASPDVAIKLAPMRPFSRLQDGSIRLTIAKDRLGTLHRNYSVRVACSPLALDFTKTTAAESEETGGMTPAMEKLASVLSETPSTGTQLVDLIAKKYGHGLKRETTSRALNALLDLGMADRMEMGPGRSALWCKPGASLLDQARHEANGHVPGGGWPEGSIGEEANP